MKSNRIQELKDLRANLIDGIELGTVDEVKASRILKKINAKIGEPEEQEEEISDVELKLFAMDDEIDDDFYKVDYNSYKEYGIDDEEEFSFGRGSGLWGDDNY